MKVVKDHILRHVHGKFLRQVGTPARLSTPIESEEQLIRFAESFHHDAYVSVHYFRDWKDGNPDPKSVIIDCVFFDLDSEKPEKAYADARLLLEVLKRSGVMPRVYFSGCKGFHLYIDIPDMQLNYPGVVLRRFCKRMVERLSLKTADPHVFGDIMRLSRLPGTLNSKARGKFGHSLYCTPLDPETLLNRALSFDEILELAKRGNPDCKIRRHESLKIAQILKEIDLRIAAERAVQTYRRFRQRRPLKKVDRIRPCIWKAIELARSGSDLPHKARLAVVAELHHAGWTTDKIVDVFRSSPDFDPEKTRYQVEHITKTGANAPYRPFKCETLQEIGLCELVSDCPIKRRREDNDRAASKTA